MKNLLAPPTDEELAALKSPSLGLLSPPTPEEIASLDKMPSPSSNLLSPPTDDELAQLRARVEPKEKAGLIDGIGTGAIRSLDPFGIVADPTGGSKEATGASIVGEIATNILVDIGTAAALGSLVKPGLGTIAGAVVGGGVGLALAVYRGMGFEAVESKRDGRNFDPLRATLSTATELNPLLRMGGKLMKGATQGVLQGAQAAAYGGEGAVIGISAVVGGVMGGIGHRKAIQQVEALGVVAQTADPALGSRSFVAFAEVMEDASPQIRKKTVDAVIRNKPYDETIAASVKHMELGGRMDFADFVKDPGSMGYETLISEISTSKDAAKFIQKAAKKGTLENKLMLKQVDPQIRAELGDERLVKLWSAHQVLQQERNGLARWIVGKHGAKITDELLDDAAQKLKSSGMTWDDAFRGYREQQYMLAASTDVRKLADRAGTTIKDPMNKMFAVFSDNKFALRAIDTATGGNLDGLGDRIAVASMHQTRFVNQQGHIMIGLEKKAKKLGMNLSTAVADIEGGASKFKGTEEQWKILTKMSETLDDIKKYGEKHNLVIGSLENYVPQMRTDPTTAIQRIRNGVRELGDEIYGDTSKALHVRKAIKAMTGVDISVESGGDLSQAMNLLKDRNTLKKAVGYEASASFSRTGDFPELLRETDIRKVVSAYANNISKAAHLTPIIKEMSSYVPSLKAMGMNKSADFLDKHLRVLSGQPSETVSAVMAQSVAWKLRVQEYIDVNELSGIPKLIMDATKVAPDFVSWSLGQVYPNLLGGSARSIIRNMTQATFVTGPEVGGIYGQRLVAKAMLETAADRARGVNLGTAMEEIGHSSGRFVGEAASELQRSLKGSLAGPAVKAIDTIGEMLMYVYGKTDTINRYATTKVAKYLTKDIMRGQKDALGFVKRLPAGAKSEIYEMVKTGKLDRLETKIADYLIGKTQFNYGPQSASQFATEAGRAFSMFTKWPTMIAGDSIEHFQRGDYGRWATRYLAPFAALAVADNILEISEGDPRQRAFLGASLVPSAPLSAVTGLHELGNPIAFKAVTGLGAGFMEVLNWDFDESFGENVGRAAGRGIRDFKPLIPGMGIVNTTESLLFNAFLNEEAPWKGAK